MDETQLSKAVVECLVARGYTTPSEFAYSIDTPDTINNLILGVLRDDEEPFGGVLGNPDAPERAVLMNVEAGRLRRLHAECKTMCGPERPHQALQRANCQLGTWTPHPHPIGVRSR